MTSPRLPLLFTAALVTALLAACAQTPGPGTSGAPGAPPTPTQPGAAPADLAGTHWVLEELGGEPRVEGTSVTAQFTSDGTVVGLGGCNRYRAAFTTSGDTIEVDAGMATTMMACDPPIMAQEASYLQALAAARTFAVADERLTLAGEGGAEVAAFVAQVQGLADTTWQVVAYNDGRDAVVSVVEGTEPSLAFDVDGTVSGNGGCNTLTGGYTAQDGMIKVGPLASTRMACLEPAGVMEQETALSLALESAATYVVEGDRLTLRTAQDTIAVELGRS